MARLEDLEALRENPVFRATPLPLLERLLGASRVREAAAGERILSEGDAGADVYALLGGVVRVFATSPRGPRVLFKVFRAPAIFGEAEALASVPHFESVEAIEPSRLLAMPGDELLRLMRADPSSAVGLILDMAARFSISIQNQRSLIFDPATTRLANYLLAHLTGAGRDDPSVFKLTQHEMAAAIGASLRSVSQDITMWLKEGIVRRHGRYYRLVDVDALRRYGSPDHLGLSYTIGQRLQILEQRLASRPAPRTMQVRTGRAGRF